MSEQSPSHPIGSIGWTDLTVPDGTGVKDFYEAVTGWTASPLDMGGYSDYVMMRPDGATPVAGICHARGPNAGMPPQWIMYVTVADLDASLAECTARGGEVIGAPRRAGPDARYCVIRDPAGAVCALYAKDVPA